MTSKGKVYIVGTDRLVASLFFERNYTICNNQDDADILCFLGGADIHPRYYNQEINRDAHVNVSNIDDTRDEHAWRRKRKDQLAVGICRGGQFINVMSGGKMLQHVSGGHTSPHMVRDVYWHSDILVSSHHHQMMVPGEDAEMMAYSHGLLNEAMNDKGKCNIPEFEPEVLWYEHSKSLCVQSHPEWNPKSGADYFFKLVDLVK